MKAEGPLLPELRYGAVAAADASAAEAADVVFTRDHDAIRKWASMRGAEPGTGEATRSGPATLNVNDGGAGIRFNFPGASPFRPISWEEWLANFDRHECAFVWEKDGPDGRLSNRYRIVRAADWKDALG